MTYSDISISKSGAKVMTFFNEAEFQFAEAFARHLFLNPFEQQRSSDLLDQLELLASALGLSTKRQRAIESDRHRIIRLTQSLDALLDVIEQRIQKGTVPQNYEEHRILESLIMGALYYHHFENRRPLTEVGDGSGKVDSFREFKRDAERWYRLPITFSPFLQQPAHMFAVYFQLCRSFEVIRQLIQGDSRPIRRLRAEIWHSIFPHELQLYGTVLYDRMQDVTTLIVGPSGTGKDLVAMAIGLSRYIAFDSAKLKFKELLAGAFHPINLSAMPIDLIESDLFGHAAGSFTGATHNRQGWLEKCGHRHTVFLDEVGELVPSIQVKLLRVLQNREFVRVGETEVRRFSGKVIAATNRDLGTEIAAGRFRQDLFYRLCSDLVRTPSLCEQLEDSPNDLPKLIRIIATKCLGPHAWPEQIDWLSNLTIDWIESSPELGLAYDWPGNFRELEQCVRNVMVRGHYHPTRIPTRPACDSAATTSSAYSLLDSRNPALDTFIRRIRATDLSYDELLDHYCSLVFARSEHLSDAARRLQKHRSTVQSRLRDDLVEQFRNPKSH
ncbi:MAG: sigma-54-dependent Fis family transcriptional regulator [Planctomyces sp.]|nr:sigma-54-dependent Fis family transcriptional regulator [Planctomyces sp.]